LHDDRQDHPLYFDVNKADKGRYWSSYSLASFGIESCCRRIELRRTVSPSISVRCRRFLRVNVAYDVDYWRC